MHARLVDEQGTPIDIQRGDAPPRRLPQPGALRRATASPSAGPASASRSTAPARRTRRSTCPAGYGYRIAPRRPVEDADDADEPLAAGRKLFLEYRMQVTTRRLEHVTPYWVRVTNCRNEPSYSVPGGGAPGSVHLQSRPWRMPADGYIVAGGAHLHGGALDITLRQPACRGRRLMGSDPRTGPRTTSPTTSSRCCTSPGRSTRPGSCRSGASRSRRASSCAPPPPTTPSTPTPA